MHSVRDFGCYFELLNGQVAFAGPRVDRCQVGDNLRAYERVFCDGRKFDSFAAFADCLFFSAQSSVDESQARKECSEIRPCAGKLLLLRASDTKGGMRRRRVSVHTSNQTCPESAAISEVVIKGIFLWKRCHGTTSGDSVASQIS